MIAAMTSPAGHDRCGTAKPSAENINKMQTRATNAVSSTFDVNAGCRGEHK
jgi:hypothetical protein